VTPIFYIYMEHFEAWLTRRHRGPVPLERAAVAAE
jgi:hypothetical protein